METQETAAPRDTAELKELLCQLLRTFHGLGWCTGTGGGISARTGSGYLMAPSGVAKEFVRPDELFELDSEFRVTNGECLDGLKLSECAPLFESLYRRCGAGAVIHSHSVEVVLAMRHSPASEVVEWERLEMIKGIRGASYLDRHRVPVIPNTPRECDLEASLNRALDDLPEYAHAVFVRDHGAYIWGGDVMEAKRHAEVYEWLCCYRNRRAALRGKGE